MNIKHPSERLKDLINALGHNVNSFSIECGYKNATTIWSIISNKKKPSTPTLNKICNAFPSVNRSWIISGNDPMFLNHKKSGNDDDMTVTAKQVLEKILPRLISIEEEINNLKNK